MTAYRTSKAIIPAFYPRRGFSLPLAALEASTATTEAYPAFGFDCFNSDGAGASEALLDRPHGIELDGKGELYITDTYNECIRLVVLT